MGDERTQARVGLVFVRATPGDEPLDLLRARRAERIGRLRLPKRLELGVVEGAFLFLGGAAAEDFGVVVVVLVLRYAAASRCVVLLQGAGEGPWAGEEALLEQERDDVAGSLAAVGFRALGEEVVEGGEGLLCVVRRGEGDGGDLAGRKFLSGMSVLRRRMVMSLRAASSMLAPRLKRRLSIISRRAVKDSECPLCGVALRKSRCSHFSASLRVAMVRLLSRA